MQCPFFVLVRGDAEKLKFVSFAASLKKRVADDIEKNAYHILELN